MSNFLSVMYMQKCPILKTSLQLDEYGSLQELKQLKICQLR